MLKYKKSVPMQPLMTKITQMQSVT